MQHDSRTVIKAEQDLSHLVHVGCHIDLNTLTTGSSGTYSDNHGRFAALP
ncbi:hypothetical protein [Ralstonia pickettii]|nr:hypothetical protein [Ralstonia pickettii]